MSSSKFDEGALFAMKVLQEGIEKRRQELAKIQSLGLGKDLYGIMNALDNQLIGLKIELEMNLVRELTRK